MQHAAGKSHTFQPNRHSNRNWHSNKQPNNATGSPRRSRVLPRKPRPLARTIEGKLNTCPKAYEFWLYPINGTIFCDSSGVEETVVPSMFTAMTRSQGSVGAVASSTTISSSSSASTSPTSPQRRQRRISGLASRYTSEYQGVMYPPGYLYHSRIYYTVPGYLRQYSSVEGYVPWCPCRTYLKGCNNKRIFKLSTWWWKQ